MNKYLEKIAYSLKEDRDILNTKGAYKLDSQVAKRMGQDPDRKNREIIENGSLGRIAGKGLLGAVALGTGGYLTGKTISKLSLGHSGHPIHTLSGLVGANIGSSTGTYLGIRSSEKNQVREIHKKYGYKPTKS